LEGRTTGKRKRDKQQKQFHRLVFSGQTVRSSENNLLFLHPIENGVVRTTIAGDSQQENFFSTPWKSVENLDLRGTRRELNLRSTTIHLLICSLEMENSNIPAFATRSFPDKTEGIA
jgi:hypothetical protein